MTLPEPASLPQPASLRARAAELLLVGGGTLVLFPLAWLLRRAAGRDASEAAIDFAAFHAALVINNPHFAVTYLLFYKDARRRALGDAFPPALRARYVAAGLLVPLALVGWAAQALSARSARSLGLLIELMFFLVSWHYAKQGFGILTVLSARRGFRFSGLERKAFLAHCFSAWAFAWANPSAPAREVQEKGVIYMSIPRPPALEWAAGIAFGLSTAALIAVLVKRWLSERRLPPLTPLLGFLVTIWLWTVFTSLDRLMMYVIPALHSVQYLYMVWLFTRNKARASEGPPLFGKPAGVQVLALSVSAIALGWVLFRGLPDFLDSAPRLSPTGGDRTTDLGETPYLAALFVIVNIHHYFMDNVLWRRDNPETRYLRDA